MRFVFDRKNETGYKKKEKGKKYKETGLLQIEVRIEGTSKRTFISTGIKLKPNQFSDKGGFTCLNDSNAKIITSKAQSRYNQIYSFVASEKCRDLSYVKFWNGDQSDYESIIRFIEKEMRLRDMKYNTMKAHITLRNKLEIFPQIKLFKDLTYKNIVDFDFWMRNEGMSNISINKMHSLFKMYIREAILKEYIDKNPYDLFIPQKAKSVDPVFLSEKEVEVIVNTDFGSDKLNNVRDMFIFQCFTGLAYTDMQAFSKNDIQTFEDKEIIRSSRTKTNESFILLFLPEAKKAAEKHNYRFPRISNQKYNDYLKLIAAGSKINKKITSHTGRHTFATYLLNRGIPLETVSKILGHANIKQTQLYARLLPKTIVSDMEKLL